VLRSGSPVKAEAAAPADRKAARRASIVAKAAELFMEHGYERTSVNEVADTLGISVGGLYRYIETKSDLLEMVCDNIYGQLPDALQAIAEGGGRSDRRLLEVCGAYLRACAANRSLILLMYREYRHLPEEAQCRYREREGEIVATLAVLVSASVPAARRTSLDAELVAQDIVMLGHMPALKGWSLRGITPERLLEEQLKVVSALVGVRRPGGADGNRPLAASALCWSGAGHQDD
jgi:AcrR family transcriptional regulator